jgi:hypothetical protein
VNNVDLDAASIPSLDLSPHEVTHVTHQSDTDSGICGSAGEKSDEGAHILGVMDEEIDISGRPMAEIRSGQSRAATQVARDAPLAGSDEVEDKIWNDPAIKGFTHD